LTRATTQQGPNAAQPSTRPVRRKNR
jgi:hypothetical protein